LKIINSEYSYLADPSLTKWWPSSEAKPNFNCIESLAREVKGKDLLSGVIYACNLCAAQKEAVGFSSFRGVFKDIFFIY